eukprot:365983-Chlamydomonas_euryale.AAC.8
MCQPMKGFQNTDSLDGWTGRWAKGGGVRHSTWLETQLCRACMHCVKGACKGAHTWDNGAPTWPASHILTNVHKWFRLLACKLCMTNGDNGCAHGKLTHVRKAISRCSIERYDRS